MMKTAQKDPWVLWKMFSGSTMTLTTHGIREGSKEDRPDEAKAKEREKEKAEEDEGSSDQGKKRPRKKEKRPLSHGEWRRI